MNLSEVNILITGGAQGIGNHLINKFLPLVKSVVTIDCNETLLNSLPDEKNFYKYCCDITVYDKLRDTIKSIYKDTEGINVLINNAGIIHNEPLFNLISPNEKTHKVSSWNKVIDINLNSVFYVTSCIVEQMVVSKTKGVIINMSSISAKGNLGQSAYSATKAAVEALSTTWAKELGMFKIRSACIAPGFLNTPSTHENLSVHLQKRLQTNIPLGRFGSLDELFLAARFIIENDYYNAKTLEIDGGLSI